MGACHLPTVWLAVFLLGSATIAENPTEPGVPTEPNEKPSSITYQSPSLSFTNSVTIIDASTDVISSLPSKKHTDTSYTVNSVSNSINTTSQIAMTIVYKYLTATATSSTTFSSIESNASSLLNLDFTVSSKIKTPVIEPSQSNGVSSLLVQKAASKSSLQSEYDTQDSSIFPKTFVDLPSTSSFSQRAATSSPLQTVNILNGSLSSSIRPMKATTAFPLTSSFHQNTVSSSTHEVELNISRRPSTIVPNTNTTVSAKRLITSAIISSSSVCSDCTTSSSSLIANSTILRILPSPSLSRTFGVWNQTSFATRTLSSNGSITRMKETVNSSYLLMTSTARINMTRILLNQTAVLVRSTSFFAYSSLSEVMAPTSAVEGLFSTVYSKSLYSTASSSVVASTSSIALSSSSSPPVHAPSAPPQHVNAYNTSSTSIMVAWQPPQLGTFNGVLTKYEVLVQKLTLQTTPNVLNSNSVDSTSVTIASSSVVNPVYSISVSEKIDVSSTSIPTQPTENPLELTSPPMALMASPINAGLNLSIIVRNLEKFKFYEVRVRAVTVKPGPYSSPLIVRTDEDVPNVCQNISLSNRNPTSVIVHWTRPLQINGVLLGYKIYYGILNDSILSAQQVESDVEAYNVSGLVPFTPYIIKVAAYTRVGEGEAATTSFKTLESVPSAVRNLTGTFINSTVVRISWARPEYPNGKIEYVVVKRIPNAEETLVPVQIYHGQERQCIAMGLIPVTRYIFSVYVMNFKHQWQSTVVDVTIVTPPSEPSGPPLDIQAITNSSTSILVHWQAPSPSLRNGLITSYRVLYTSDKTAYRSQTTQDNTTSLPLTSLKPYTLYYIRIQAVNVAGAGPLSEQVTNRTFEDAPSPPTNVTARSVNATCVLVTWGEPVNLNGEAVNFRLYYRLTSLNASLNSLIYDGESTMYLVSRLHEYVSYTFTLFAYNVNYGYKSASVVAMEITHPAAPSGPPQNCRAVTLSSRSILVQWNPPKVLDMNGLITSYNVTIKRPDGTNENRSVSGSSSTLVFTSLHPYAVYLFTIRAVNKVGTGPRSPTVSNRTFEEVPDAPIINQVTNLSSTVFQVSWLSPRNPNGVLIAYKICWDLLGQSMKENCTQTNGSTTTFSMHWLVPFSWYNISIAAATSEGYGQSVSGVYRTMEGVPTKPQNVQGWNTSASSIFVTWTAPVLTNGILTSYNVSYQVLKGPKSFSSGLSTSMTLYYLQPFTLYTVCIRAATSQGFGAQECESIRTEEGVPDAIPSFEHHFLTSHSVQLTWSTPSRPNGKIGYILCYHPTINREWTRTRRFSDIQLEYFVTNLDPYTSYNFSIRAYNLKRGLEGPARLITATTKTARPSGPPLNVRLVEATSETLTISWDPPAKPNGPITDYFLIIYDVRTPMHKDYEKVNGTRYTIAVLKPWRNYSIQIAGIDITGLKYGPKTIEYIFRTLPSAPPKVKPIKKPEDGIITPHVISIELQKASEEYGKVSFYQVIVLEIAVSSNQGKPIPPSKSPEEYKPSDLLTYQEAKQRKPDLVPYIAAEFRAMEFDRYRFFKVGDARNYSISARKRRDTGRQYYNGPLEPNTFYSMFQRAAVSKDLYSSSSWLKPVSTAESSAAVGRTKTGSNLSTGLVVGLCVTFLVIIIFVFVVFTVLWK